MGEEPPDSAKNGSPESTTAGASQVKAIEIMSPLMAPCWECQESGVRGDGQWCSWGDVRDVGCRA